MRGGNRGLSKVLVRTKKTPQERGFMSGSAKLALGACLQGSNELMVGASGRLDPGIMNPGRGHDLAALIGVSH